MTLQLNAPFRELFDRARQDDTLSVPATISYRDDSGRETTIDGVTVSLRGNTSRRETECAFPKLKLHLASPPHDSIFAGQWRHGSRDAARCAVALDPAGPVSGNAQRFRLDRTGSRQYRFSLGTESI